MRIWMLLPLLVVAAFAAPAQAEGPRLGSLEFEPCTLAAELQAGGIELVGRTEAEVSAELGRRIVEEGPPDVMFGAPTHPRTQQFLKRITEARRL